MRRILFFLVTLLLGAATTVLIAAKALIDADRAERSGSSVIVRNGTEAWMVRTHDAFGLRWVNCERAATPLVSPVPTLIDIPSWAVPPEGLFAPDSSARVATLAVGWPRPIMTRQWATDVTSNIFPLQVEIDDGNDSLRRAASRFTEEDPGVPRNILWRGVLINTGIFWLAWGVVGWLIATIYRAVRPAERINPPA